MNKFLQGASLLSIAALALVGCGSNNSASSDSDTVQVVTTTDVYADIVEAVAGDTVEVTPIINSTSQDPHSYEATSADRLTVKDADLVVLNGGGYDQFLEDMAGVDNPDQTTVNAVKASGMVTDEQYKELTEAHVHVEGEEHDHVHSFNEHVWYDLGTMKNLAQEIADDLGKKLPENAEKYNEAAKKFGESMEALQTDIESVNADGKKYAATEPVAAYLLLDAGFTDATPADLVSAVENESDIAPLTLQEVKEAITDGSISFLAYNEQTSTNQTEEIRDAADAAGVPNASFTETLPEGKTYVEWMTENIKNIKNAVA